MPQTFDDILAWTPADDGAWYQTIDSSWFQGRGVFGGAIGASFAHVFRAVLADDACHLRAMTLHFLLPMADVPSEIRTSPLRAGRTVHQLRGDLWQQGQRVASASAAYVAPRDSIADFDTHPAPNVPPADEVEPWPDLPIMPAFAGHIEYRQCLGAPPYSGADEARIGGWTRLREPRALDEPLAVAFLDTWPPPIVTRASEPGAAATIMLHAEILHPLPLADSAVDADTPWLVEHHSAGGRGGFHEEDARLWAPDGTLVARARQTRAIFR